jgi:prefoldin subunit 5
MNLTVRQLVEREWRLLQQEIETIQMVIKSIEGSLAEQQQRLTAMEEREGDLKRFLVAYDSQDR